MKKLLLLLIIPLLFSCNRNNTEEKRVFEEELVQKGTKTNPVFYYEGELFTGIGLDVYNTGSLFIEANYKQGIMGLRKYYHNNGQLEKEGFLKGGKQEGLWKYYDENGKSSKRTIMKTPINGARLSSTYGNRKHPILGFTKMHRGLDFAAPTGTPVFAAGDGIIEKAGWNGSYGKYIRIRHTGTYKTAYAHLSGFHKNVRSGKRVSQGKIIGYVGTTGRSTGPHLHYEVIKNNIQVNPMRIKLPAGKNISKGDINNYKNHVQKILSQKVALEKSNRNKKLAINNHNISKILICGRNIYA